MKKLFVLSLAVIAGLLSLHAQSKEVIIAYFDKDLNKVTDSTAAAYYRTAERQGSGFIARDYTTSRILVMQAECSRFLPALIINGKVTQYYENGKIKAEGTYEHNNPTGLFEYFYNTGTPKEKREYTTEGIRYLESFSQTGEALLINGNGLISETVDNGIRYFDVEDHKSVGTFTVNHANDTLYTQTDTPAEYRGGYEQLLKDLVKTLRFPVSARRMGMEGTVFVSFIVPKTGPVEDIKVDQGFREDCDVEAVRATSQLNDWVPAKHKGKIVRSTFTLPIKFKAGN